MKKFVARKVAAPYKRGKNGVWASKSQKSKPTKWRLIAIFMAATIGFSALVAGQIGSEGLAAALANPLSIFSARSPGGRMSGELTQTKPARKAFRPRERVKSEVRDRPVGPGDTGYALPEGAPTALLGPPEIGPEQSAGPLGRGQSPLSDSGGGGGGGVPREPTFPSQIGNDTDIETSVPEPATWMTLIVGIFIIGARARMGRSVTSQGAPSSRGRADNQPSGAFDTLPS